MKLPRLFFLFAFGLLTSSSLATAQITWSGDIIDEFIETDGASSVGAQNLAPGTTVEFDVLSYVTSGTGQDGQNDLGLTFVGITTSGFGDLANDGNNVDWSDTTMTTDGTGVRTTIDPDWVSRRGVNANNSGNKVTAIWELRFLDGITVAASNIDQLRMTSNNTAGIAWETTTVEYLDSDGNPFSNAPTNISDYLNYMPINGGGGGQTGLGTFVSDDTTSIASGVGTNLVVAAGSNPSDDTISNSDGYNNPTDLGLASEQIGGIRIMHMVEDVRGTQNGDTTFTTAINDLEVSNIIISAPEPSTFALSLFGLAAWTTRRRQ